MKTFVPDYYPAFSCRMGACRHSCCIGWEIDIDPESLKRFRGIDGSIGAELRKNIVVGNNCASFRLSEGDRCPFLNDEGLCRLILQLGEDCLCQICADHPRYRNFFAGHTEIGLGLSCEAAAELVLKYKDKVNFRLLEDDGIPEEADPFEQELLDLREHLIGIMQDRSMKVAQRLQRMLESVDIRMPGFDISHWKNFFLELERLDEAWTRELEALCVSPAGLPDTSELETAFEQLAVYLLQRHLPGALEDDDISGRICFVVLAVQLLQALCSAQQPMDVDRLCALVRMFSGEIEYSDENIGAILDELHRVYPGL